MNVTEEDLFRSYRTPEGYSAPCACGTDIDAPNGTEWSVAEAVRVHNESTIHEQWSGWQEAVHALQRPARKPCPCHAHTAS